MTKRTVVAEEKIARCGFGKQLASEQFGRRWWLNVEQDKGQIQGFATIDTGCTYLARISQNGNFVVNRHIPERVRQRLYLLLLNAEKKKHRHLALTQPHGLCEKSRTCRENEADPSVPSCKSRRGKGRRVP